MSDQITMTITGTIPLDTPELARVVFSEIGLTIRSAANAYAPLCSWCSEKQTLHGPDIRTATYICRACLDALADERARRAGVRMQARINYLRELAEATP